MASTVKNKNKVSRKDSLDLESEFLNGSLDNLAIQGNDSQPDAKKILAQLKFIKSKYHNSGKNSNVVTNVFMLSDNEKYFDIISKAIMQPNSNINCILCK